MKKIKTFITIGLVGYEIEIEADMSKALPAIDIIGLPDVAIKEAKWRIRSCFKNAGIQLPNKRITLNLAPSDIKKVGTSFDFPMAVAIFWLLMWDDFEDTDLFDDALFFGELGLDGSVKRVNGLLPSVISAMKSWFTKFFVPAENLYELEYIENIKIYPIAHFEQILWYFMEAKAFEVSENTRSIRSLLSQKNVFDVDFAHIKWHFFAKRACAIAAAGFHNMLFVGAPGSGKTMLSKAIQSILPPLTFDEILETSQIYSLIGGLSKQQPLITKRPFRQIHHTASPISIVGGGRNLRPGEISLAHKGILFFDELTEFPRDVLEVLRQPLEDKKVRISRVSGTVEYPAEFMFLASMNPCKCGYYQDPERECSCNLNDIRRYQSKLSGPFLDRIDMILEVPREKIEKILEPVLAETSDSLREKVHRAWQIQQERYVNMPFTNNANIDAKYLYKFVPLNDETKLFLKDASERLVLSPRLVHKIMKLARTIADFEWDKELEIKHLAEAMQYRSKNFFV